jgi:hypothetical protein
MTNIETGRTSNIIFPKQVARKIAIKITNPILKSETTNNPETIAKAEKMLENGHGLIIITNHFSERDGLELLKIIFNDKAMAEKKVITPMAYHMVTPLYRMLGKMLDVTPMPIVTQSTIDKGKSDGKELNDGKPEYLGKSITRLKEGGIVVITPQGSRMPSLGEKFNNPALGTIMSRAEAKGIGEYGLLLIGLGIKEATDYSEKMFEKFNLSEKYTINVGNYFTNKEIWERAAILAKAEGRPERPDKFVDTVIHEELRKVVPPSYR